MEDSRYNTLLIVEGEKCEYKYFSKFASLISKDRRIKVVPFCNDIYEIYKSIKELDGDTTTIDVLLYCLNLNDDQKEILIKNKFVYIYLVFDLELQNDRIENQKDSLSKIEEMLNLFNNETSEYGKLFINYPMMESYRHFKIDDAMTLENKTITSTNEVLINYKNIVGMEGDNKNIYSYTLNDFYNICKAHLMQAMLLTTNCFKIPSINDYYEHLLPINLHLAQQEIILKKKIMLVLNTSSFIYAEFYQGVSNKKN